MNINLLLENGARQIESFSDTPQLDAQVLIAHIIGKPRSWVAAHGDAPLTDPQIDSAQQAFTRLKDGEPLPYILGCWEFFGLELDITHDVLIPRPETELLVEKAIARLKANPRQRNVADVGTGSGAIAVSIAMHVPDVHVYATDISRAALNVARRNAEKFHVHHKIKFAECDLLPNKNVERSMFNVVCANLPYIPTTTLRQLPIYGKEPTLALDGGADGLDLFRRLFQLAPRWLAPQGMLLLEIESTLGMRALSLAYDSFTDVSIHLRQDLAGKDRLLEIVFK
ncbi:MAG: peptide chain release factor N(5)-glutamine methyltransferase [Chloroflexi bacterium]|nr:peptide chain release factor N(5)-glutamine methyltransferase [Chloroflexota bacterium]